MNSALVIMAAGLGSRYGGVKQIEKVGPCGEILMEYAIYDAVRAGFDKLIVIVKKDMEADCRELFGNRIEAATGLPLYFAVQDTDGSWDGISIPASRTKPLGTVHALLSAKHLLDRPFAVINADDYYGPGAFRMLESELHRLRGACDSAMAAYLLKNTVSAFGSVTRGVCSVANGVLQKITETFHITLMPDGLIRDCSGGTSGPVLAPDTPVSMNMWGYHPDILPLMETYFGDFLRKLSPDDNKSECLLPVMMDSFLSSQLTHTRVLRTDDRWFGLTYQEDRPGVRSELLALRSEGVYPAALWN